MIETLIDRVMHTGDSYKYRGLRSQLVELLYEQKGISDRRVLRAMEQVPRHLFMDKGFEEHAYQDKPFPIGEEQTISSPYTVAYQTELLKICREDKVLEIGTGSGYQTAILVTLGAKVYTIERQETLYHKAKRCFRELGYSPEATRFGDGYQGMQDQAPFDKIIVTAGAMETPNTLLSQLTIGGRLVVPIGEKEQVMTLFVRQSKQEFNKTTFGDFRFVPMLKDIQIMEKRY